jgi:cytochrome P450
LERYDVLANENIQEPFVFYQRLREEQPIYWNQRYSCWMFSRYEDVKNALRATQQFSSQHRLPMELRRDRLPEEARNNFDIGLEFVYGNLNSCDPPKHSLQRQAIMRVIGPFFADIAKTSINQRVNDLVDRLERAGSCDFVSEFSMRLPAEVIGDLLGITEEYREALAIVPELYLEFPRAAYTQDCRALDRIAGRVGQARRVLNELISDRRRKPLDDLISILVSDHGFDLGMNDDEIVQLCAFLFLAGYETTSNLLSSGLRHLLEDRRQWQRLVDDPGLVPSAVDELLRFVSPVLWVGRFTTEDVEWGGHLLEKGSGVMLGIGSANHDPSAFENPEILDITRNNAKAMAFGHGIHTCLGAALAKMEAQAALTCLVQRIPLIRLETDTFTYKPFYFVRSLESLPISVC